MLRSRTDKRHSRNETGPEIEEVGDIVLGFHPPVPSLESQGCEISEEGEPFNIEL